MNDIVSCPHNRCLYIADANKARTHTGIASHWQKLLRRLAAAAIDRRLLPAGPTAANPQQRRANGQTGGQTDGRTSDA